MEHNVLYILNGSWMDILTTYKPVEFNQRSEAFFVLASELAIIGLKY
jgi:hypothetical protein